MSKNCITFVGRRLKEEMEVEKRMGKADEGRMHMKVGSSGEDILLQTKWIGVGNRTAIRLS